MKSAKAVLQSTVALGFLLCFVRPPVARADIVEIGDVVVSNSGIQYHAALVNNLSDADLDWQLYTIDGTGNLVGDILIAPLSSLSPALDFSGYSASDTFSFSGVLSSLDFTVGAVTYEAASLDWTSATWTGTSTGTFAIDISATPITTTPEPGTVTLLLAGLLGLCFTRRSFVHG